MSIFANIESKETREYLDDLFSDQDLNQLSGEIPEAKADELLQLILEIEKAAPEPEGARLNVIAGKWSINLTGTCWPLVKALVGAALAVAGPDGLTKLGAIALAWDAIVDLKDVISKLDPGEIQVARFITQAGGRVFPQRGEQGVSVVDIKEEYTKEEAQPPIALEEIIKRLVAKKAVSSHVAQDGTMLYKIAL